MALATQAAVLIIIVMAILGAVGYAIDKGQRNRPVNDGPKRK